MSIASFSPRNIIDAINANPDNLTFGFSDKAEKNVTRFFVYLSGKTVTGRDVKNAKLIIALEDVKISKGPENPNDPNSVMVKEKYAMSVEFNANDNPELLEAMKLIETAFFEWVDEMKLAKKLSDKKFPFEIVKSTYGEQCPDASLRGKDRTPVVRVGLPLNKTYSEKHPVTSLRGKCQVEVLDYTQRTVEGNRIVYPPMRVPITGDENSTEPVNYNNAYKAIKTGCIIKKGRIDMSCGTQNMFGISISRILHRLVIEPPIEGADFEDEIDEVRDQEDDVDEEAEIDIYEAQ